MLKRKQVVAILKEEGGYEGCLNFFTAKYFGILQVLYTVRILSAELDENNLQVWYMENNGHLSICLLDFNPKIIDEIIDILTPYLK